MKWVYRYIFLQIQRKSRVFTPKDWSILCVGASAQHPRPDFSFHRSGPDRNGGLDAEMPNLTGKVWGDETEDSPVLGHRVSLFLTIFSANAPTLGRNPINPANR
jgi:hypothetical protein